MSKKISVGIILVLFATLTLVIELSEYWFGDNIAYSYYPYLYLDMCPVSDLEPVNTFADVIEANNQNYLFWNGRYVAHFFVILFCGLLGQGAFAICNSLVWITFLILLMKVGEKKLTDLPSLFVGVTLSLYLMVFIAAGPATQINYIWMFALSLGWILLFQKARENKNIWCLILLGIYSLIAGNGQEGANIGICGALLIILFRNKFQFTRAQWTMGIAFGLGCIADCMAPGTIFRSGTASGGSIAFRILQFTVIACNYFSIPLLFLALITGISRGFNKHQFSENLFIWCALGISVAFILVLGSRSWNQYFGIMLFIAILTLRIWKSGFARNIITTLIFIWCVYLLYNKYNGVVDRNNYLSDIETKYQQSPDGIIFVDASNPRCMDLFSTHREGFVLKNGQKKPITVFPDEIKKIKDDSIVNYMKQYSHCRFMLVQSKIEPKQFNYNLSFRFLNYIRPISNNLVDFGNPLYETDTYRILMINGYPFLHHEITMVESTDE